MFTNILSILVFTWTSFACLFGLVLFVCLCFATITVIVNRFLGLVVKTYALRAAGTGFNCCFLCRDFSWSSHTSDLNYKIAPQWLACQVPGIIRSASGLVGLVLVHCDWVRKEVGSAASVSVWQLRIEQIRPRDTLACCWDVNFRQPTNEQTVTL